MCPFWTVHINGIVQYVWPLVTDFFHLAYSFFLNWRIVDLGFPCGSAVKNPPAMQETQVTVGSILWSGRFPGRGYGNPLQHSCLENPMDRGAWWATVRRVAKSRIQLKQLSTHKHTAELQCCVNFWCTAKWFNYTYINIFFFIYFPLWFITGYWI